MSVVLNFVPSERVAVIIEGIRESALLTTIARDVRRMLRRLAGRWRVCLRPVDRGCWRLELTGASGRHVWLFAAPASSLAVIVVEKLEAFLDRSAAPFSPAVI